jgi:hypothetical protein
MTVAVYDETGNVGAFTIATVDDAAGRLTLTARPANTPGTTYMRGSNVVEASLHVYYLKTDPASQTFQLMHYDGFSTDRPVVDHIVGLTFEFHGDRCRRPSQRGGVVWTVAAAVGVQPTTYPAERIACSWSVLSGERIPRLR